MDRANHDQLNDPIQSAHHHIGHVTEGERLAQRYRLPHRIREFIVEHHGTTQVTYFYQQARSAPVRRRRWWTSRSRTRPAPALALEPAF